ncbi:hypoxanthine-guanine phosphoribosyltransferase [Sulfurirhabdus autotrophica]|uniref:Hypoxanthine phosphoribosyltransferase n=1 Tax=Sulfurirhabdus autotrophica TaxID=1706046 RepID=A0A4R3YCH8_9PROT|nr:hypoxanthine-guanine phosphoribosyltransferase [Sulfurirhabdus autotrophica]TCV90155.1 hypoxanthine phosphoribosyltransferase [Sulfurirhabdus autotrophica]
MLDANKALDVLNNAELIASSEKVSETLAQIASEITVALSDKHPLVLSVMGGAVVFTGQLLPKLSFPLDFDYIHVTRYGNNTQGGLLDWKVMPRENVAGRVVLVLDDILDEGHTLAAIREKVLSLGASAFYSAVFTDKQIGKQKPIQADFVGMQLPNKYVFGFGMDVQGAWRNLPAIYAMKE